MYSGEKVEQDHRQEAILIIQPEDDLEAGCRPETEREAWSPKPHRKS